MPRCAAPCKSNGFLLGTSKLNEEFLNEGRRPRRNWRARSPSPPPGVGPTRVGCYLLWFTGAPDYLAQLPYTARPSRPPSRRSRQDPDLDQEGLPIHPTNPISTARGPRRLSRKFCSQDLTKILWKAALVTAGRGWFATNSYGGLSTGRNQIQAFGLVMSML